VGLGSLKPEAVHFTECLEGAGLIDDIIGRLLMGDVHQPPAKAQQIGKAGVGAHRDPILFGPFHRAAHPARVAGMKTAGNIGVGDALHDLFRSAQHEVAQRLAHITIEIDPISAHGILRSSVLKMGHHFCGK
jgi:hypothetical protein